ncbi:hypothetical protein BLOT_003960 [Blomia tropicalis]|nr:hypothetical protein BLOT_003960 [Blomia tropicalis]
MAKWQTKPLYTVKSNMVTMQASRKFIYQKCQPRLWYNMDHDCSQIILYQMAMEVILNYPMFDCTFECIGG